MRELSTCQDDAACDDPPVMFGKQEDVIDPPFRKVIEVGLIKVIPGIGLMFIHRHLVETRKVAVFFWASETDRDAFATCLPDVTACHLRESTFDRLERIC